MSVRFEAERTSEAGRVLLDMHWEGSCPGEAIVRLRARVEALEACILAFRDDEDLDRNATQEVMFAMAQREGGVVAAASRPMSAAPGSEASPDVIKGEPPRDGKEYRVFIHPSSIVVAWESGLNVWNNRSPFDAPGWGSEASYYVANCSGYVPYERK